MRTTLAAASEHNAAAANEQRKLAAVHLLQEAVQAMDLQPESLFPGLVTGLEDRLELQYQERLKAAEMKVIVAQVRYLHTILQESQRQENGNICCAQHASWSPLFEVACQNASQQSASSVAMFAVKCKDIGDGELLLMCSTLTCVTSCDTG